MSEMLRDSFISISRKRKNGPAVQKFREIVAKNFLSVSLEKLEILSFATLSPMAILNLSKFKKSML